MRPAQARIDLKALQHNFNRVRTAAPNSKVMAVVKANAYGHGLVPVAQALNCADALAVVCLEEAISLREAGFGKRIVLLEGPFEAEDLALVHGYRLDMVIHHESQLDLLERGQPLRSPDIWLKLDTGMHRLGFAPAQFGDVQKRLKQLQKPGEIRCMTHFACADEPDSPVTRQQLASFDDACDAFEGERSLANSAGVLAWPAAHADWVRPGIMLYGSSPFSETSAESLGLQPVMTLSTRLIAVNRHRKGEAIGYGGEWTCPEDMPVGVAAIGYGDGYPRHAPSGMPVLVNGKRTALAGRVSMDMICIDLRSQPDARVGDEVTLWGAGLPVDEVASQAGTIGYELLCG
ncbi:MAG: alanine racemase, partial [Gammaproteobacteria bacterium]|nr:alanine racemase [Gammaproteobacteria bacterium]